LLHLSNKTFSIMSFQNFVIGRLTALTSAINSIVTNAKNIEDLPHQDIYSPLSKVHVSNAGVSQHLTIQDIVSKADSRPIDFMELRIIARGGGNTTGTDQPGDFVSGWGTWDSDTNTGVYWDKAIWNGGNRSDRANYTVLQISEIGT
jgi:hypothetical protein